MEDFYRLSQMQEERIQNIHKDKKIIDCFAASYIDGDYIKLLKKTGINAVHYTIAGCEFFHGVYVNTNFQMAYRSLGEWNRILDKYHEDIELATSLQEMQDIWERGKIAIILGLQNGSPIEDNLDNLKFFYNSGIRFLMLAYNRQNFIGCGSDETRDSGLSDFGKKAIKKMNELGIAIDLSHVSNKTSWEAIDTSEKPCIFTHVNPIKMAPTPRNKSDELIKFCVSKGGVVAPKHMIGNMINKLAEETTVDDYVGMIDYWVNLVGVDNVILGTDFSGTVQALKEHNDFVSNVRALNPNAYIGKRIKPVGYERIDDLFNVTRGLVKHGYSNVDIEKIYSLNLLRYLEKTWKK